ncbi:sugar ABC transporter ATP-binding protein [Agathobaculum sp. NTUH-O15-33]|uniref:sugar ABC transporter ATP-binding protein n=1 Tax=Agathobaculum sp. NTUH-O15-33 TaxID=3079302 RepID=UPI0029584F83|nr:sugar ABC transporter ATP-binding protein [Agathobaculum sp. NTUH-O15-33]WNX84444.1 sugar ABC transporter ATP-binding protein [Agathobaculum sp. NTUH-O15-33]
MDEILRMNHISKRFPGVLALAGVNLTVHAGEVHALMGENGAGKSTLMKILSGVYQPDTGSIMLNGQPIHPQDTRHSQELGISVVFQELNICPHLSVADNIFIGRHKTKRGLVDDKWTIQESKRLLSILDADIDPKVIASRLSVSALQMIEIAKALSFDSKILVLDEPTSSLTAKETDNLFRCIEALKANGMGIIYISHRLEELHRICDRVTVLRDGRQIGETRMVRDVTIDEVVSMMVGRTMEDKYPTEKRTIGEVVFEAKNVRTKALLDVKHMQVRAGEIVGLSGLVGAGRTELCRAIFGADPVLSKEVLIDGRPATIHSPKDAIACGIGYLSEDRKGDGLAITMDVEKNINMASLRHHMKYGLMNDKMLTSNAHQFVKRLRIKTPSIRQLVKNLSGGNQQKIVIAKTLSNEARLVIFDEPTRGIDVGAKYEIYEIMNELSRQGIGIIMISSEMPEILGMSDRIIVMHGGRISGELTAQQATQEEIMRLAAGLKS